MSPFGFLSECTSGCLNRKVYIGFCSFGDVADFLAVGWIVSAEGLAGNGIDPFVVDEKLRVLGRGSDDWLGEVSVVSSSRYRKWTDGGTCLRQGASENTETHLKLIL